MDYFLVTEEENLPFISRINLPMDYESHIHKELEIMFVLEGGTDCEVNGRIYHLKKHDIFIINPLDTHQNHGIEPDTSLFITYIDLFAFNAYFPNLSATLFLYEDTLNNRNNPAYQLLYDIFHRFLTELTDKKGSYRLKALECIVQILDCLCTYCLFDTGRYREHLEIDNQRRERVERIIDYLNGHYAEQITLPELAKQIHLSVPYLSKYFKTVLGVGFLDYLNRLRINHSLSMLITTKDRILDISLACGFRDHKSYSRCFEKYLHVTPSQYRKQRSRNPAGKDRCVDQEKKQNIPHPASYLPALSKREIKTGKAEEVRLFLSPDEIKGQICKVRYHHTITVPEGNDLLYERTIKNIKTAKDILHPRYLRVKGIFNECFQICRKGNLREINVYFSRADTLLGKIVELGFIPYIVIPTIPPKICELGKNDGTDMWIKLLKSFLNHCRERYGEGMDNWRIQLWDDIGSWPFPDGASFFDYLKAAVKLVREISSKIQIGFAGISEGYSLTAVKEIIRDCKRNKLLLDFFPVYTKINIKELAGGGGRYPLTYLREVCGLLKNMQCPGIQIAEYQWVLERNKNLIWDTAAAGSILADFLLHIPEAAEEVVLPKPCDDFRGENVFFGDMGLMTWNSICKNLFYFYELLSRLDFAEVYKREFGWIGKKERALGIIFFQSSRFTTSFFQEDKNGINQLERYGVYENGKKVKVNLVLDLPEGLYKIQRILLGRRSGSPFDEWIEMGAPRSMTPEMAEYLIRKSIPKETMSLKEIKDKLRMEQLIPEHGIVYIHIERMREEWK